MNTYTFCVKYILASGRPMLLVLILLTSCGGIELTSVVDTQFLLTSRSMPLNNILVVCDTRNLALKDAVESSIANHLRMSSDARVFRDIDLYSPLKTLTEKEKLWAIRDAEIGGVLYMNVGESGRSLRDWLYTEATDIDVETQAWQSSVAKLFIPSTGVVVWAASMPDRDEVGADLLTSRSFRVALAADLLQRGIIEQPQVRNPGLRGFNR